MGWHQQNRLRCYFTVLPTIRLEQMFHDHWWMGLEAGGKYFHLNFGVKEGRLSVNLSDQGEEYAEWEGDSRETPTPNGS